MILALPVTMLLPDCEASSCISVNAPVSVFHQYPASLVTRYLQHLYLNWGTFLCPGDNASRFLRLLIWPPCDTMFTYFCAHFPTSVQIVRDTLLSVHFRQLGFCLFDIRGILHCTLIIGESGQQTKSNLLILRYPPFILGSSYYVSGEHRRTLPVSLICW